MGSLGITLGSALRRGGPRSASPNRRRGRRLQSPTVQCPTIGRSASFASQPGGGASSVGDADGDDAARPRRPLCPDSPAAAAAMRGAFGDGPDSGTPRRRATLRARRGGAADRRAAAAPSPSHNDRAAAGGDGAAARRAQQPNSAAPLGGSSPPRRDHAPV
eukprot:gene29213-48156_t